MRRLHRPENLFADGLQLKRDGQFGEWLWEVLTSGYEKLTDEERTTAVVRVEVEESGLYRLCWMAKGTHAATEEREWVLVNVPEVQLD